MKIITLLRSRLTENPSDETLVQLRMELTDAEDWLKSLADLPPEVREAILNMPSKLISAENDKKYTVTQKTCPYCHGKGGDGLDLSDYVPCPQCGGLGVL
jgi:hypothetical protein